MRFGDLFRKRNVEVSNAAFLSPEALEEREKIVEDFQSVMEMFDEPMPKPSTNDDYFHRCCDEKSVLLVGLGKNVRGSMSYILNELNHSEHFEGFSIYVRTSQETEQTVKKYIRKNHWDRTKAVTNNRKFRGLLESCKYLITETYFPFNWVKTPEQVYINIWHGTPLKKIGLDKNSKNSQNNGNTQRNFIDADYLLYPNDYTRDNMLKSYKVARLMYGKTLMLGYPRTGGMLAVTEEEKEKIRKKLAPNGEKLFAYMPTFKDYMPDEQCVEESRELLDYLDENLTDDQILYVNLHHRVTDAIDYTNYRHIKQFPPLVDSYHLLTVTDALITDFSSVFFDYLALGKQIILHIEDYNNYRKMRGTYIDLMEFPFDKAESKEAIIQALNRGRQYDDTAVRQQFCGYDSPQNARKLCQLLYGDESGLTIKEIPKDTKETEIIYSDCCQPGTKTDFMYGYLKSYDKERKQVYVSCDMDATAENKNTAFPMLFEHPVIGWHKNFYLSSAGKAAIKLYQEGKITFDKAMEVLRYDYALASKRMFGRARIDTIMIYDTQDPEMILALALAEVPHKVLFIHDTLLEAMTAEDPFARDAVSFAARFCEKIVVQTAKQKKTVQDLLQKDLKDKYTIVNSIRRMMRL